jgi:hypothetical protein
MFRKLWAISAILALALTISGQAAGQGGTITVSPDVITLDAASPDSVDFQFDPPCAGGDGFDATIVLRFILDGTPIYQFDSPFESSHGPDDAFYSMVIPMGDPGLSSVLPPGTYRVEADCVHLFPDATQAVFFSYVPTEITAQPPAEAAPEPTAEPTDSAPAPVEGPADGEETVTAPAPGFTG